MSTIFLNNEGDGRFYVVLDKDELSKLAAHIMVTALEDRHNHDLNPVFNTIVTGAKNAGCDLFPGTYRDFKKLVNEISGPETKEV